MEKTNDIFGPFTAPADPIPEDPEERKRYLEQLLEEAKVLFRDKPPEDIFSPGDDELELLKNESPHRSDEPLNEEPRKRSRDGRCSPFGKTNGRGIMQWDDARKIFQQFEATAQGDAELCKLKDDLLARAARYARLRTDWQLAEHDLRRELDGSRTAAHNALIDACNILSRAMNERGRDISWRARLGQDRREIGDFACYIHCVLGLSAR
jgi:hypothetical protein